MLHSRNRLRRFGPRSVQPRTPRGSVRRPRTPRGLDFYHPADYEVQAPRNRRQILALPRNRSSLILPRSYRRRNPDEEQAVEKQTFTQLRGELDRTRARINALRENLSGYFVEKQELIDLMCVCTIAQEPLLIVGPPGTAKSDLVTKFCEGLGLESGDYFEYMLSKFTEPSELLGPIDLDKLKKGAYFRKTIGKLPEARVAFLDEVFMANSAILNTLLTIINERKFYQDGQPVPVRLRMLFGATNVVPEFEELAAIRDRFTLKAESLPTKNNYLDELLEKGTQNELYKTMSRKPWGRDAGGKSIATLDDFIRLRRYLSLSMVGEGREQDEVSFTRDRKRFFPDEVFDLFKRIVRTIERELHVSISDRKMIKLYNLIRCRALLFHGGAVQKDDLILLRYIGDRNEDFGPVREKVDDLLRLDQ